MSIRSTTNYGGQQLPSDVWVKIDYLEREPKGNHKQVAPVPVSKPDGTNIGKKPTLVKVVQKQRRTRTDDLKTNSKKTYTNET